MKLILGKKIGMTTIYNDNGEAQNVTLIESGKNVVTQIRTSDKDGYSAIQVGLESSKKNRKFDEIQEFRFSEEEIRDVKVGDEIVLDGFEIGDKAKVSGITKGKGFQGVVKKWGFAGSPASHGHRHDLRAPGSIGSAYPQKVFKGKKMAGRMGGNNKTIKNIEIVFKDTEKKLLALKGAIPGNNGSIIRVWVNDKF
ncbi:MAG: 50S ribosomal protein L3 [Candidatus Moranbacteria bacterium]|nr:50S ribosomal protein L3 [Candidatus Moranbacteria bacterium]